MRKNFPLFLLCLVLQGTVLAYEVETDTESALAKSVPIALKTCPDAPTNDETKGPGGLTSGELVTGLQKSLNTLAERCPEKNFLSSLNAYQAALQGIQQRAGIPNITSNAEGGASVEENCGNAADLAQSHAASAEWAMRWNLTPGPAGYAQCFCAQQSGECGEPCIARQRNREVMETLVRLGCNTASAMRNRNQILSTRIGIINDVNRLMLNLAETPASCIQGPGGAEFIAGLLSTTSQTAAIMATLEPVSGVGGVGIGVAANLMNKMLEKIYQRNTAAFALKRIKTNLEDSNTRCFLRFAGLYLSSCNARNPLPKGKPLPESPCQLRYFGRAPSPDSRQPDPNPNAAPVRKVLTYLNEIELNGLEKTKVGKDPVWDQFVRLFDKKIADPRFNSPHEVFLKDYLATVAQDLKDYADKKPSTEKRRWAVEPTTKGGLYLDDFSEQAQKLTTFLNLMKESQNSRYDFKKRSEFRNLAVKMIKGAPAETGKDKSTKEEPRLDLAEILRRHWEATLPNASGLEALLANEYGNAAMDRLHHEKMLAWYQVVPDAMNSAKDPSRVFEQASSRVSVAEAYTSLVNLERNNLVAQLKKAEKAYEDAKAANAGDETSINAALDEGASDLITLCSLPGPFYGRTQGIGAEFAHNRVENISPHFRNPLSSREAFQKICRKVQCEGGLPPFVQSPQRPKEEKKAYERRIANDLAQYQCEVNAKLPEAYRNLRQNFRKNRSFCGS
jgi:hypothetical protein